MWELTVILCSSQETQRWGRGCRRRLHQLCCANVKKDPSLAPRTLQESRHGSMLVIPRMLVIPVLERQRTSRYEHASGNEKPYLKDDWHSQEMFTHMPKCTQAPRHIQIFLMRRNLGGLVMQISGRVCQAYARLQRQSPVLGVREKERKSYLSYLHKNKSNQCIVNEKSEQDMKVKLPSNVCVCVTACLTNHITVFRHCPKTEE